MEKKNLYRQTPWSFKKYLLNHLPFWLILFFIFICTTIFLFYLSKNSYFNEEIVYKNNTTDIELLVFRSDIFTTIVVTNPFDYNKPYEISLGYNCNIKNELLHKKIKMEAVLYKRNYNNTFFVTFPHARKLICNKA